MDGLLVIDKPAGITSHDVVNRIRRILGTKRVGHTGTLDPFATGVMVVVVGRATRLAQFLDKDEKEYVATVRFGSETDTGDRTGVPSAECGMRNEEIAERLASTNWEPILERFRGEMEQVPPMYSAKKVDGKKLYESARKGIAVERNSVRVVVHELEILDDSRLSTLDSHLDVRVVCSAGTYIRTLAEDIGRAVGVGAHLTELRRTQSGRFTIDDSITLDRLGEMDDPETALLPTEKAVEHLAEFRLWAGRVAATRNGMSTRVDNADIADGQTVRMISPDGELIAIGVYSSEETAIKPKVVLV